MAREKGPPPSVRDLPQDKRKEKLEHHIADQVRQIRWRLRLGAEQEDHEKRCENHAHYVGASGMTDRNRHIAFGKNREGDRGGNGRRQHAQIDNSEPQFLRQDADHHLRREPGCGGKKNIGQAENERMQPPMTHAFDDGGGRQRCSMKEKQNGNTNRHHTIERRRRIAGRRCDQSKAGGGGHRKKEGIGSHAEILVKAGRLTAYCASNWSTNRYGESMAARRNHGQVLDQLRQLIEIDRLKPQDALPPERDLAKSLGCSRESVRKALAVLEREGAVWRRQGQGTFVGPAPVGVPRPLRAVLSGATPRQLMRARLIFEPVLAQEAARAATPPQIARLRWLAEQTGQARDWREYEQFDEAFHKTVAEASGNALLIAMFTELSSLRGRALWQREHDAIFRRAHRDAYAKEQAALHGAVVDAIAAVDGPAARDAMGRHLIVIDSLVAD